MTPQGRATFNTWVGAALGFFGFLALGLTAYMVLTPLPAKPVQVITPKINAQSCQSSLAMAGYRTSHNKGEVTVFEPLTDDPKTQMLKASYAIAACKLTLVTFCMGEACPAPGLSFTLNESSSSSESKPTNVPAATKQAPAK